MTFFASLSQENYKIVVLSIFCIIVILIAIIRYLLESKRKQEISDYCKTNNINYSLLMEKVDLEKSDSDLLNYYDRAIAVMSGKIDDYKYYLFDKTNKVSGENYRRNNSTFGKTICIIYKDNIDLPHFYLRDESIVYDHILDSKEKEDINFSDDSVFSKKFILMGPSESKVRAFFDRRIRDYFVRNHISDYVYEGYKNSFEISVNKVLNLKERIDLLNKTFNIFKDITSETGNIK